MKIVRLKYLCLAIVLTATHAFAQTGNPGVEVRPASSDVVQTGPQEVVTTLFRVTNNGEPLEFAASVELPGGWKLVTQELPFQMESGTTEMKMVSIFVPQMALAGSYTVTYRVHSREKPAVSDQFSIQIEVLPVSKMSVAVFEEPVHVVAGDQYIVVFNVTNQSNVPDDIKLSVESSHNLHLALPVRELKLKSSESRSVSVLVKTDEGADQPILHQLKLIAKFKSNSRANAAAHSQVEVLPRIMGKKDPFHRLPLTVNLNFAGQAKGTTYSGFQGDILGGGPLDEEGNHQLDFRFRGPDIYEKSMLAEHDEYYLHYQSKRLNIHAGDKVFTLSSLTENARYGRGVEAIANFNQLSVGGFYQKSRWLNPAREEAAGFARFKFGEKWVGINLLRKQMGEGGYANIAGFEGILEKKQFKLGLEGSVGMHQDKSGYGWKLLSTGNLNWFKYYINWIYASPDYAGYYRNTNYLTANVSFQPVNAFRFYGGARHERRNFDVDTTLYTAPSSSYYTAGAQYRVRKGISATLEWIQRSREDRLDKPKFNYRENVLRFQLNQLFPKFAFNVGAETGRTRNYLADQTYGMNRLTAGIYYYPLPGHSLSGYVYYDDNSRVLQEKRRRVTIGLNARLNLSRKTAFHLTFQNNYAIEEYFRDRNIFEVQLNHIFPWKHRIMARARVTIIRNSENLNETAFMLRYSVPLGIPLGRRRAVAQLKGMVHDAQTGERLQDLLLRVNGFTAVTNNKGEFLFPALEPGKYYLTMDNSDLGFKRLPLQKMPAEIVLEGGETRHIELSIGESAGLSGRVTVYGPDESNAASQDEEARSRIVSVKEGMAGESDSYIEQYNVKNILIELQNGETIRQLTDREGSFQFSELRPGKWTLRVYGTVPEYHYFEQDSMEFMLKSGDQKDVVIRVLPRKRKIRVIEDGGRIETDKKQSDEMFDTEDTGGHKKTNEQNSGRKIQDQSQSSTKTQRERDWKDGFGRKYKDRVKGSNEFGVDAHKASVFYQTADSVNIDQRLALNMQRHSLWVENTDYEDVQTRISKGNWDEILSKLPVDDCLPKASTPDVFAIWIASVKSRMENQGHMISHLKNENSASEESSHAIQKNHSTATGPSPLRSSVYSEPDEYVLKYQRGLELFYQRRYEESIAVFSHLLQLDMSESLTSNCYFWIGECQFSMGNYRAATLAYQEVLSLHTSRKYHDAQRQVKVCALYLERTDMNGDIADDANLEGWLKELDLPQ